MPDDIILVDEKDNQIGTGEKMNVHRKGLLHHCFFIFIFNSKKQLMLQRRALTKYHSPGVWSNTCCSHPKPNEETLAAAHRRLQEEMGFDCELKEIGNFIYHASFDNGLTEHEFDHVIVGNFEGEPKINLPEACEWKWIGLENLKKDLEINPKNYSVWLREPLKKDIIR